MNTIQRRQKLLDSDEFTGVDYVLVEPGADDLPVITVYFLGEIPASLTDLTSADVTIESVHPDASPSSIRATSLSWTGEETLQLKAADVGEHTPYRLKLDHQAVDRCFRSTQFSFQAVCDRDIDCRQPDDADDDRRDVDFPVDYMARDFDSLRRALLEFASQRYPNWSDATEADVAVVLMEMMAAVGDELSYYQDRIGREAFLETATQRRSLHRQAQLVDYRPSPGQTAGGWVTLTVAGDETGGAVPTVTAGTRFRTAGSRPRHFEVGEDFHSIAGGDDAPFDYPLVDGPEKLEPYLWCDDDAILREGAEELWVEGDLEEMLGGADTGQLRLLISERPRDASETTRNWPVVVDDVQVRTDELTGVTTTRIGWNDDRALPFDIDLKRTSVHTNLVPVVAGRTHTERFVIGASPLEDELPEAVERLGADATVAYRFTLPGSDAVDLAWDRVSEQEGYRPHVALRSVFVPDIENLDDAGLDELFDDQDVVTDEGQTIQQWDWRASFAGFGASSTATDRHFVLEPGSWLPVKSHQAEGQRVEHVDYAGDAGMTILFGDGQMGRLPAPGTVFEVTYRLGGGRRFNVAPYRITEVVESESETAAVTGVSNPLATEGGADEESKDQIRSDAPQAYRAITYRAVRPPDYEEAAERMEWVDEAGADFRWTGSWTTAFVTADPRGEATLAGSRKEKLHRHLDRFRQVGRPVAVREPEYVDLDLRISLCVEPGAEPSEVQRQVLDALHRPAEDGGQPGVLHPDRFTFGDPLDRGGLEAFLQSVSGVMAVEDIELRRQGWFDFQRFEQLRYEVADHQIVRIENDPAYPNRGTVELMTHGGL